jgi:hypothetical protein
MLVSAAIVSRSPASDVGALSEKRGQVGAESQRRTSVGCIADIVFNQLGCLMEDVMIGSH